MIKYSLSFSVDHNAFTLPLESTELTPQSCLEKSPIWPVLLGEEKASQTQTQM